MMERKKEEKRDEPAMIVQTLDVQFFLFAI